MCHTHFRFPCILITVRGSRVQQFAETHDELLRAVLRCTFHALFMPMPHCSNLAMLTHCSITQHARRNPTCQVFSQHATFWRKIPKVIASKTCLILGKEEGDQVLAMPLGIFFAITVEYFSIVLPFYCHHYHFLLTAHTWQTVNAQSAAGGIGNSRTVMLC